MKKPSIKFIKKILAADPAEAFRFIASDHGLKLDIVDHAEELFRDTKRIDLIKMHPVSKGFILILNQRLSLWFYKRGDNYKYDGFEMGPYGKGHLDPEESER